MIRYLFSRIGCVLLLVGCVALILGVAAEASGEPAFTTVAVGVGLGLLGFFLWNGLRPKERRNARFARPRGRAGERDPEENDNEWKKRNDGR